MMMYLYIFNFFIHLSNKNVNFPLFFNIITMSRIILAQCEGIGLQLRQYSLTQCLLNLAFTLFKTEKRLKLLGHSLTCLSPIPISCFKLSPISMQKKQNGNMKNTIITTI